MVTSAPDEFIIQPRRPHVESTWLMFDPPRPSIFNEIDGYVSFTTYPPGLGEIMFAPNLNQMK